MIQSIQFFLFVSLLSLCAAVLTWLTLNMLKKWVQQREQNCTVPCTNCHTLIYSSALLCFKCGVVNKEPHQLGFWGHTTRQPAFDLNDHQKKLLLWYRCPVCAAYFEEKAFHQSCAMCGTATLPNARSVRQYLQILREEKPRVIFWLFVFGLIPVVGTVLALVYYQHSFVASMYNFVPNSRGQLRRRVCSGIDLLLITLQPIFVFGAFTLPLMVICNCWFYQTFLECESGLLFGWFGERSPTDQPILFTSVEPKRHLQHVHLEHGMVSEKI